MSVKQISAKRDYDLSFEVEANHKVFVPMSKRSSILISTKHVAGIVKAEFCSFNSNFIRSKLLPTLHLGIQTWITGKF